MADCLARLLIHVPAPSFISFAQTREVPDALLSNPEELAPYLPKSHAYTQTLPPKKFKKKAK